MRSNISISSKSSRQSGEALVEAAMIFPIIIIVAVIAITTSLKIYTSIKENSIDHKSKIQTQYEEYEKSRLFVGFYHNDTYVVNGFVYGDVHHKS